MRLAVLLSLVVALSLFGCIVTEEEEASPTPLPTVVISPTPTEVPTPTTHPSPTPVASPTPVPTPSPTPDVTPSCVISADPDTATGPFTSRVAVAFRNVQAATVSIKCTGAEVGQDVILGASGVGGRECSYPAVSENTAYTVIATAGGASCNASVADMKTPFPVISSVANGSFTSTSAVITWSTDQSSDTQVEYGTSSALGSATTRDANLTMSHTVTLTGLTQNTTYYYKAVSCNTISACTYSAVYTFTTVAVTIPVPTVTLNTPATNAWQKLLAQTFSFTPTAGSGGTLSNCTLRTNVTGSMADTQANTSALTSGGANNIVYTFAADNDYSWNVRCYNVGSSYGEAASNFVVKIDSAAPAQVTDLTNTSASSTQVDLSWSASSDSGSGLATYLVYRNATNIGNSTAPTVTYSDTSVSANQTYQYYVVAADVAGNYATQSATFNVNTP